VNAYFVNNSNNVNSSGIGGLFFAGDALLDPQEQVETLCAF
jgi:hypothetical protein